MPGFATFDQIIQSISDGYGQEVAFHKLIASTNVINVPHTLWTATGTPLQGAYPTVGAANGRVLTRSTTGSMAFANATGGRRLHLLNASAINAANTTSATLLLIDRISDVQVAASTVGTTTITGVDATTRLATGEGAMLWVEVASAVGAAASVLTVNYTNQAGTNGRTCANTMVASSIAGRSFNASLFQSLQAGDFGVRSIQSYSITSGTTGNLAICLIRPLGFMTLPTNGCSYDTDWVLSAPYMPRIYDDSCLSLILISGSSASNAWQVIGELRLAEN